MNRDKQRLFCRNMFFYLLLAMSILMANKVHANESHTKPRIAKPAPAEEDVLVDDDQQEETIEERFIRHNKEISGWFDSQAEGLDLFLAGQKLTNKKNETAFRIENTSYIKERENFSNATGFRAILRLPNVEKYWQLQLTDFDEVEEKRSAKSSYLKQAPREKNYGATIGWFQNLGKVRTSFQPRIELQDPLKVSHSFAFESVADLGYVHINPKLELFAHPDKGVGIFNAYNFDFPISRTYSLTWINEGEYQEKSHNLNVTHGLSLGHHISAKRSMSYNIFYDFNNRPSYNLFGYNLSVSWVETIYRRILDYRVTPYLEFLSEKGFVGVPGLNFHIIVTF